MFPIALKLGEFTVHSYGVLVAAGYMAAITYVLRFQKRIGLSESRIWGLLYSIFGGAIVGGKVAYAFASWSEGGEFLAAFIHFRYGFVFYGGLIGGVLFGLVYARLKGLQLGRVSEPFAAALPLGHAIGRLGCFAAGCCYGEPTRAAIGVRFTSPDALVPPVLLGVPLHPAQLYEAAGNFAIFAFIHTRYLRAHSKPSPAGNAFLAYLALYAALRFAIEFVRADERGLFAAGLSPSQWTALATSIAAGIFWARSRHGQSVRS